MSCHMIRTTCHIDCVQLVVVVAMYLVTLLLSGLIIKLSIGHPKSEEKEKLKDKISLGTLIGKCENILTITMILVGAYTALALIFTSKSIIRQEQIRTDPKYYLGGTLINFTFSVVMGFLTRYFLLVLGHPLGS